MILLIVAYIAGWLICSVAFSYASPIFSYECPRGRTRQSWRRTAGDASFLLLWPILVAMLLISTLAGALAKFRSNLPVADRPPAEAGGNVQNRGLSTGRARLI